MAKTVVIINSRFPTPEEIVERSQLSARRRKVLDAMVKARSGNPAVRPRSFKKK